MNNDEAARAESGTLTDPRKWRRPARSLACRGTAWLGKDQVQSLRSVDSAAAAG
jgi:hypothetical protein